MGSGFLALFQQGSVAGFTQYRLADRTRTDFTLKNFVLPANVSAT